MAQTPEPASSPATWGTVLWSNLAALAIVLWFCLRNLALALEARGKIAALLAVPPLWLYGPALALAAAALVAAAVARLRGLPADRPHFRLLPILAVILLAVEVFAVPRYQLPLSSDELVAAQAAMLDPAAFAEPDGLFTVDGARVSGGLGALEAPFVGRDGAPLGKWRPAVRADCAGAVTELPAAVDVGAVVYCVSADRTRAWLSFVGLEGVGGKPRVVAADESGATVQWERQKRPPEPQGGGAAPAPDGAPAPGE